MNCQFCNSPLAKDFTNLFTCGTSHPHRSRYRSTACELGEKIFKLTSERDALKARVIRLEEALVAELKNAELRYEQEQRDGDGISIASTRARFIALRDACGILQAKESNP